MIQVSPPYIRYVIAKPFRYWWQQFATPFLTTRGWTVIDPSTFSFPTAYGYNASFSRTLPGKNIPDEDYCLEHASIVVEFQRAPIYDSIISPFSNETIVDDLLAFMSVYTGQYCQYLWKELVSADGNWCASTNINLTNNHSTEIQAATDRRSIAHFQTALSNIPRLNQNQFGIAMRWFFTALREFEIGRPLLEAALNWVCLESQANYLGLSGHNYPKVRSFLDTQGFSDVPLLRDLYKLRNDAFHSGALSQLDESHAQAAHKAGRSLIRASLLVSMGMTHTDFSSQFSQIYQ